MSYYCCIVEYWHCRNSIKSVWFIPLGVIETIGWFSIVGSQCFEFLNLVLCFASIGWLSGWYKISVNYAWKFFFMKPAEFGVTLENEAS